MSEEVKKALTAGVQAFQQMNGSDPDYNDTPEIAAAIVAFLRALPEDHALRWWDAELQRHGGCDVRALHALAAAVEQEARDA